MGQVIHTRGLPQLPEYVHCSKKLWTLVCSQPFASIQMSGTSENLLDAFGFETFPMQSQPTSLPLHSTEVSEVALLDLGSPTVKSNGLLLFH